MSSERRRGSSGKGLGSEGIAALRWRQSRRLEGLPVEKEKLQQAETARLKREVARLVEEIAFLKRMAAYVAKQPDEYGITRRHEGEHPVALICRSLKVSRSGYYEWWSRPPSERIRRIPLSRGTCGAGVCGN